MKKLRWIFYLFWGEIYFFFGGEGEGGREGEGRGRDWIEIKWMLVFVKVNLSE